MLGDAITINNFNWNPVVLKTPKKYHFLAQLVQKWGPHGPRPKEENNIFAEIKKPDHKLSKTFYFTKVSHVFG